MSYETLGRSAAWACLLASLGCALHVCSSWAVAAEENKLAPAEHVARLRNKACRPQVMSVSVQVLGDLTDTWQIRGLQIAEALLETALRKGEDAHLRADAVRALGRLQSRAFPPDEFVKNLSIGPFIKALQDPKEELKVRAEIAKVFRHGLKLGNPSDNEAFEVLVGLAEDSEAAGASRAVPLKLRMEAVGALGALGSARGLKALSNVLNFRDLDPLLKEMTVVALADLLAQLDDVKGVEHGTLKKLLDVLELREKAPLEVRIATLKALAQLQSKGMRLQDTLVQTIRIILQESDEAALVSAAVEALGVIGDAACLDALAKALRDTYSKERPELGSDVTVRAEIMATLGYMLRGQARKPQPEAVKRIAELLVRAVDLQAERPEVPEVALAAAFNLRYLDLFPKDAEISRESAVEKLVQRLRQTKEQESILRKTIMQTLECLTEMPFDENAARWVAWYDAKHKERVLPK